MVIVFLNRFCLLYIQKVYLKREGKENNFWKVWNLAAKLEENSQKNQSKVCIHAKRRNLRYYNVSRDESPQRENEMDSPSFEGFHALLDLQAYVW